MKLALIGNYGATNIGDEAILTSILKSHPGHEWVVFSANPQQTAQKYGVDAVPLFPFGFRSFFSHGFRRSLKALKSVDAVVLGGGGLLQDDVPQAALLWSWQAAWAKRLKKPLFMYANGVGPLNSAIGRRSAKSVAAYAGGITVRDEASQKLLYELQATRAPIGVTADPAFLLEAPTGKERERNTIAVSLRPWKDADEKLMNEVTKFLLDVKEKRKTKFVFPVMQHIKEHDFEMLETIAARTGGQVIQPADFSELLDLLAQVEFAVGMRYHFLIASMMTQTPSLSISYSPKVDSLIENTRLKDYSVAADDITADALIDQFKALRADYNNVQAYQKTRYKHFKELAVGNADALESFLKGL